MANAFFTDGAPYFFIAREYNRAVVFVNKNMFMSMNDASIGMISPAFESARGVRANRTQTKEYGSKKFKKRKHFDLIGKLRCGINLDKHNCS
jgi:hypothetical protein